MANTNIIKKPQALEDFEPQGKSLNDIIETAGERVYRLRRQQSKLKPKNETMTRERKHFLFINPEQRKSIFFGTHYPTIVLCPNGANKELLLNNLN